MADHNRPNSWIEHGAFLDWLAERAGGRLLTATVERRVRRALETIQERVLAGQPVLVNDVVRGGGCARRTMERAFRNELSQSIQQVIGDCRLFYAAKLLRRTTLTITETALRVGYSDASQLSKAFRRRFGQAPSEFRQKRD